MTKTSTKSEARKEIAALNKKFCKHANAKDPIGLVRDFYAPNALLMPPGAPDNLQGTEALNEFWKKMIDEGAADVTLKTQSVESSGDLAYEIGQFGFTSPSPKGDRVNVSGKYVVVYKRQPGGRLKAEVDMFSTNT